MVTPETWLAVPNWPYQVSRLGHIKRSRGKRPVDSVLDNDGYTIVTLHRGKRELVIHLDELICEVFGQRPIGAGYRPLHLNGLPWDNWPSNLNWGLSNANSNMENLVTNWTVKHGGKLQHGPVDSYEAAISMMRVGDVLLGRNPQRKVVSFELHFNRNRDMSPRNPFDLAKQYRAIAAMHNDQFWSLHLSEAAEVIEALANESLVHNAEGQQWPLTALRKDKWVGEEPTITETDPYLAGIAQRGAPRRRPLVAPAEPTQPRRKPLVLAQ